VNHSILVFKALADDNRLAILKALQEGEQCGCNLLEVLDIGQPTLSHHMKLLVDCGLVASRKEGKWTYYSISETALMTVIDFANENLSRSATYYQHCKCD